MLLERIATRLIAAYRRRQAMRALLDLNDHILKDIGFQRDEIVHLLEQSASPAAGVPRRNGEGEEAKKRQGQPRNLPAKPHAACC